jgi:hypothetical protein
MIEYYCPEDVKVKTFILSCLEDCQSWCKGQGCKFLKESKCTHPLFDQVNSQEVKDKIEALKKIMLKPAPNERNDKNYNTLVIETISDIYSYLGVKE